MVKKKNFYILCVCMLVMIFPFTAAATGGKAGITDVVEISWEGRIVSGEETCYALDWVNEKHNVKITPNGVGANDGDEVVQIMLSTGEFPDVGNYWVDKWDLYDEGTIRSIPFDMIRKNMPNYIKILEENPIGWLLNVAPDKKDEHIAIMGIANGTHGNLWTLPLRVDWIKKVGFDISDYDKTKVPLDNIGRSYFYQPKWSLDEWERLLTLFKNEDPDGNGKDDTIPWGGDKHYRWTWEPLCGAFGVVIDGNMMIDGKLYDWRISPNYKEFLKLAQKWYSKGLIDKEYPTLELAKAWEKLAQGQTGTMPTMIGYVRAEGDYERPPTCLATVDEVEAGAEVACTIGPVGPGGQGSRAYLPVSSMANYQVFIGSHVTDEKLVRIMQVMDDVIYGPDENWMIYYNGKEGVHYDWEGEPYDSKPIKRTLEDVPEGNPKQGGWFTSYPPVYTTDRYKFIYHKKLFEHFDNFILAPVGQEVALRTYKTDIFSETNLRDLGQKYNEILNTMHSEFYMRAVIGEIDIDAEWDAYVKKFKAEGGDEMIAEMEKAPIVSELIKGNRVY